MVTVYRLNMFVCQGSISYGTDLAILSICNHTILDYGTFGLWAGLLAGGRHVLLQLLWLLYCVSCRIVLPLGYSAAAVRSPDMVWWEVGTVPRIIRTVHVIGAFFKYCQNVREISLTALMVLSQYVDRLLPVPEWTTWSMWTSRSWTSGPPSSGLDSRY